MLFDSLHHGLQQVLDLRQTQHSLTAANLANADTPGYKARFIPFDQLLAAAVQQTPGLTMQCEEAGHLDAAGQDATRPEIEEIEAPPWSFDGNSVVAERETARLTENSMLYSGVSQGISRRLAMLRYAADDGR